MRAARAGIVVAGCVIAGLIGASPRALQGQAGGNGATGPGHGRPGKVPGTVAAIPVDPGRPWGWAVKAFMEDPDRQLYNTTKSKR